MKFIISFLLLSISLSAYNQVAFNAAQNGLLVRQDPDTLSSIIGKLEFGEKVQIIERTDRKFTIDDNGDKIEARWYKIISAKNSSLAGYVFSGYLTGEPLSKKREIQLNGYSITVTESSIEAFERRKKVFSSSHILDQKKCLEQGLIDLKSKKEVEVKLSDKTTMILKQENDDDQFFGYTFLHFDSVQQLYFFWENWLEAGHPIMIEASTGKITEVVGSTYTINENILAVYGEDIDSGWTPNGIQLFKKGESLEELFYFNPQTEFNERWGPIDIAWANDSTILIECLLHNADSGYVSVYKKLKFEKQQ